MRRTKCLAIVPSFDDKLSNLGRERGYSVASVRPFQSNNPPAVCASSCVIKSRLRLEANLFSSQTISLTEL